MTGGLENEAALYHPGNAVVKPLTVSLDPWEAHQLDGESNKTNKNNVTKSASSFELSDLSLVFHLRSVVDHRRSRTPTISGRSDRKPKAMAE
jgi:hypothetical protein